MLILSTIEDNNIISMYIDNDMNYIGGDSRNHVFILQNKNILMVNKGDASNVLLIKNNKYNLNSINKSMLDAQETRKSFQGILH